MNRLIDFTNLGGLYTYQDTLEFLQETSKENIDAIAALIGDKIIIGGVTDNGDGTFAPGFITYQGQIFYFIGGLAATNVIIDTVVTKEQFDDAVQRDVYTVKTAKFSNAGGFPFTDLQRLPFNKTTLKDNLTRIQTLFKNLINFEDCVIVDGCVISDVDTGAGTLAIASGLVMFAGEYVVTNAYAGTYPVYLKSDATFVTDEPDEGLYITFNPYTSQYYKDVKRRWETPSGKIEMYKVLSNRFDVATGLGKWEWLGFKICDDIRGRVPVGYDRRTVDPADNIWDVIYNTPGHAVGNENKHTITGDEQGKIDVATEVDDIGGGTESAIANIRINGEVVPRNGGSNQSSYGDTIHITPNDGTEAMDLRQPGIVIVFIEKI